MAKTRKKWENPYENDLLLHVVDVGKIVVDWLRKDDPYYIEEKIKEEELTVEQMEREGEVNGIIKLMQRTERRRKQLDRVRAVQWNPPIIIHRTAREVYLERVMEVFGKKANTASGKKEIASLFKKTDEDNYHNMYVNSI